MNWFMIAMGFIIALIFIIFGVRFAFQPVKMVQYLQRMKYQQTGEVDKRAKIVSIVMGSLLVLVGIYYLVYVILAIVYPA